MSPVLAHSSALTSTDAAVILGPLAALLLGGRAAFRRLPAGLAWWTAIACLFGAQYIHWAVVDPHWAEWAPAGIFFVVIALIEGLLAVGLIVSRSRRLVTAVIAFNLATVVLWAVSRTVGLPIGPGAGRPEALGRGDYIASLLELAAVLVLRPFLRPGGPAGDDRESDRGPFRSLSVIAAMVVYVVGITAYGLAAADPHAAAAPVARAGDARLVASRLRFDTANLTLPASRTVQVQLTNNDEAPHNLAVYGGGASAGPLFRGPLTEPGTSTIYTFEAPPPGIYTFHCDVHPGMTGRLIAR